MNYIIDKVIGKLNKIIYMEKPQINNNGVEYVNWIVGRWFEEFIKYRLPQIKKYNILFCSVEGKRYNLEKCHQSKVFVSFENLEPWEKYKNTKIIENDKVYKWFTKVHCNYFDYRYNDVDLILGYLDDNNKFLRFPGWITDLFLPTSNYSDIKKVIKDINNSYNSSFFECACINRHDAFGLRSAICDEVSKVIKISYAGKWRNNTNELWEKYDNNKIEYLKMFKFNICSENMDAKNYCTEKIFNALSSGCLPIYAGALNNPEPFVINKDRVILWNFDGDNSKTLEFIDLLNRNSKIYKEFSLQPKLNESAADYIWERFNKLEEALKILI